MSPLFYGWKYAASSHFLPISEDGTSRLTWLVRVVPATEKMSVLISSVKHPTSPAHTPEVYSYEEYQESASRITLQNQRKSAVN